MTQYERSESQALLTRAADVEAQRQAASRARDVEHEQRLLDELRTLWARYAQLEQIA